MYRSIQHLFLGLWLLCAAGLAFAAVPHESAVPAYAEEQTILQREQGLPEPGFTSPASGREHMDRNFLTPYAAEGTVIVQRGGNTWRTLRNGPLATISGFLLLGLPLVILLFYLKVGPIKLHGQPTGRLIRRFTNWERAVHWATAISFIALALTGLIILFGKKILLPLMGHDAFSWLAIFAKWLHNLTGPLFAIASVLMFYIFFRDNIWRRYDWEWIKKGGGFTGGGHIASGRFNAGEKLWFWGGVTLLGLIVTISGFILNFANFGQTRYILQLANYFHLIGSVLYITGSMGHIYIGTKGVEGAYRAMREGVVDETWAKEHHEYWYNDIKAGGGTGGSEAPGAQGKDALRRS